MTKTKTEKKDAVPENPVPWRVEYAENSEERYADIIDANNVYVAQYLNVNSAELIVSAVNAATGVLKSLDEYEREVMEKLGKT